MDVEQVQPDDATIAFNDMRDKLAGLTRAVDSMAGEWKALDIPDYTETFDKVAEELAATAEQLEAMAAKPGLKLTPASLSDAIIKASSAARAEDHVALAGATKTFRETQQSIASVIASARTAERQTQHIKRMTAIGFVAGMLIFAVLPGPIIRALPTSWHLPERMAAKALGTDAWEGGQRLMMLAHPEHWNQISIADRILRANDRTLSDCASSAAKSRKFVRCTVTVSPDVATDK